MADYSQTGGGYGGGGDFPPPSQHQPPRKLQQTQAQVDEVVNIMSHLMQFFPGAEEPIIYPGDYDEEEEEDSYHNSNSPGSISGTLHPTSPGSGGFKGGRCVI